MSKEIKNQIELLNKEFGLTTNEDGTVTTNSLKIAEYYGKEHKDVIRKIRKFIELVPELAGRNFTLSDYIDGSGKKNVMYEMDRQGFSMLVNKFTGDEAFLFTVKYTNAFERMVELIKQLKEDNTKLYEIATSDKEQEKRIYEAKKVKYGYKSIRTLLEGCTYKNIEDTVNDIIDFHTNVLKKNDRAFRYNKMNKTEYKQVIRDRIDDILQDIYCNCRDVSLIVIVKELQYRNQKDKVKTINRSNSHK